MPDCDWEDTIMRQTVLGVFDSYADARSAQRTLGEAGVAQADIAIYSMSTDAPVERGREFMHRATEICTVASRYLINSSNCSHGSSSVASIHRKPRITGNSSAAVERLSAPTFPKCRSIW